MTTYRDTDEQMQEVLAAGNELLESLKLFIQGNNDQCTDNGTSCYGRTEDNRPCPGLLQVDDDDYDSPAVCDLCGAVCGCTRCSDRSAIQRWCALENKYLMSITPG